MRKLFALVLVLVLQGQLVPARAGSSAASPATAPAAVASFFPGA